MENERGDHPTLAEEEERILRCLGAAVIMQWNTLPTKLQKELFDNARVFRSGSLRAERMILFTTTLPPAITSIRGL